jgi:hypothetical protein
MRALVVSLPPGLGVFIACDSYSYIISFRNLVALFVNAEVHLQHVMDHLGACSGINLDRQGHTPPFAATTTPVNCCHVLVDHDCLHGFPREFRIGTLHAKSALARGKLGAPKARGRPRTSFSASLSFNDSCVIGRRRAARHAVVRNALSPRVLTLLVLR